MSINRAPITTALVAALAPNVGDGTSNWLADNAKQPKGSGWQGDPGDSAFVPYIVLTALPSQELVTGLTADGWGSRTPIVQPYAVTCIGNSARQCELLADRARDNLVDLSGTSPAGANGEITSILPVTLGGIQRTDQDHGSYFVQTDVVNVRISPA